MNSSSPRPTVSAAHVPSYSLFAQLLATERLRVTVRPGATTASFSPATRVLTLPSWTDFDEASWLLFIAHEVGHALYTPANALEGPVYTALCREYGEDAVRTVVNVFEDIRIERRIREQYRGLSGVFSRGYHALLMRQFFGFKTLTPTDWAVKTVLDRVNVYAKVGALLRMSLTQAQEIAWYNRAVQTQTYDDVLVLVSEVMSQLSADQRAQAAQQSAGAYTASGASGVESGATSAESGATGAESGASADTASGAAADTASGASADTASGAAGAAGASAGTASGSASNPFAVDSQQAAERTLRAAAVAGRPYENEGRVTTIPFSTEHLHHNDRTIEQLLEAWQATSDQRDYLRGVVLQQRREQSSILASMIAAFRANQAAWQSRRAQVAKSGVIDPAKLAQYKLVDDLFLRRRSLPEAQNHGFVLHVDMSGSMDDKLSVVLWQVLHLIWFAESIKVPVSVYGFTNTALPTPAGQAYAEVCRQARVHAEAGALLELYRSTASPAVKQSAQALLFAQVLRFGGFLSYVAKCRVGYLGFTPADAKFSALPKTLRSVAHGVLTTVLTWMSSSPTPTEVAQNALVHPDMTLGGTPLYFALVSSVDTVRAFRQRHRVEQCISVWLTDGEDTDGVPSGESAARRAADGDIGPSTRRFDSRETGSLVDLRSGRTFPVEPRRSLATLFAVHRALTGATVVCIDITRVPLDSFSRILSKTDLSSVTPSVSSTAGGPQAKSRFPVSRSGYGRARTRKAIKQTRKRVVIAHASGTFEDTGLLLVTRAQYADIGCDAYLVTHPDWWLSSATSSQEASHTAMTVLAADDDDLNDLTAEEREDLDRRRPVRLAAALADGAAHVAMRRFADLLVPYMAAGREDATV